MSYYPFDSSWIERQKFNWQYNTQVAANRKFDQFLFLNTPLDLLEYKKTNVYINGPKYNHLIQNQSPNTILEVPFYRQMPKDVTVKLSRNNQIKD